MGVLALSIRVFREKRIHTFPEVDTLRNHCKALQSLQFSIMDHGVVVTDASCIERTKAVSALITSSL